MRIRELQELGAEDVGNDRGTAAADILRHGQPRVLDLIGACCAGELLYGLDDLVDARCAYGVTTALEPTHCADGNAPVVANLVIVGHAPAFAAAATA